MRLAIVEGRRRLSRTRQASDMLSALICFHANELFNSSVRIIVFAVSNRSQEPDKITKYSLK